MWIWGREDECHHPCCRNPRPIHGTLRTQCPPRRHHLCINKALKEALSIIDKISFLSTSRTTKSFFLSSKHKTYPSVVHPFAQTGVEICPNSSAGGRRRQDRRLQTVYARGEVVWRRDRAINSPERRHTEEKHCSHRIILLDCPLYYKARSNTRRGNPKGTSRFPRKQTGIGRLWSRKSRRCARN